VLGLGAGWYDAEYVAFGYTTDHRVGRFEEALQIVTALLSGDSVTLSGRSYRVREAALLPPPQRPIPILVAAKGPRMLRLVARHADAWNTAWFGRPDDRLRRRLTDLDEALTAEGRDPTTLRRTVGMDVQDPAAAPFGGPSDVPFRGSVSELAEALDEYAELGFDDVIVGLEPRTERSLGRLAEAVRRRPGEWAQSPPSCELRRAARSRIKPSMCLLAKVGEMLAAPRPKRDAVSGRFAPATLLQGSTRKEILERWTFSQSGRRATEDSSMTLAT
jgi:hypothetical protein